jgi:hypothetical protein
MILIFLNWYVRHLNPIRAGITEDLEKLDSYPYCGHSFVMGKCTCYWQDVKTVLQTFAPKTRSARRRYRQFVAQGIDQGKRTDLIGGGLIRSLGGWKEIKKLQKEQTPMKGDERILGDSDFVNQILTDAEEQVKRQYHLKTLGINIDMVAQRVSDIVGLDVDKVWSAGKNRKIVQARSILCYWAITELGMTMSSMARSLNLSVTAVSMSVARAKQIVEQDHLVLLRDEVFKN